MVFSDDDFEKLGIHECVESISASMAIGIIATKSHLFFSNLTRQFLASADVTYRDSGGDITLASEGTLSYLA